MIHLFWMSQNNMSPSTVLPPRMLDLCLLITILNFIVFMVAAIWKASISLPLFVWSTALSSTMAET